MIEVLHAGPLTLVQDRGRVGLAHLGVPRSGAADLASHDLANRLVGNDEDAATLELTLGSAAFRFDSPTWIALTGATAPLRLNGRPIALNQARLARTGDVLRVDVPTHGLRTYLAAGGGIDVTPVLGSRSTDTLAGLGPAPLAEGDLLPTGAPTAPPPSPDAVRTCLPTGAPIALTYRLGPRADRFAPEAVSQLETREWRIAPSSNRVGVRLDGERLSVPEADPMPSEGLVLGAIEVPPSGLPIVLLADHPATGGYPVIGVVDEDAVARLAQVTPGASVHFERRRGRRPMNLR